MTIKNKVSVIGLGYVGFPLAHLLGKTKKYEVCGFDIDENKINRIKKGLSPIEEKKFNDIYFQASTDNKILSNSKFYIVCVPTPVKNKRIPDFKPIIKSCETITKYLKKGQHVIIESTINPGVCEEIVQPILEKSGLKAGKDFELSHCPERINPGDPKWNLSNLPRNLGSLSTKGLNEAYNLYTSFINAEIKKVSSIKIAEAAKIIENTFRDINIAFVNELAKSFDVLGIDLLETIQAASSKFSFMAHYPSCGVGGHCIPVDPYYLIQRAKKNGFNHTFVKRAREINNSMPKYTIELLEKLLNSKKKTLKDCKITLLGLSYKSNLNDLRESPALEILKQLKAKNIKVKSFDPHIPLKSDFKNIKEALQFADAVILATSHNEFLSITGAMLKANKIIAIVDGKNCLDKANIQKSGILYKGIGH